MLGVKSIDVRFGEKRVLRDVTLRVGEGESVAVLGPSGSGKSTLLRAVAGLVPVDSGSIAWDGEDITTVPTHSASGSCSRVMPSSRTSTCSGMSASVSAWPRCLTRS